MEKKLVYNFDYKTLRIIHDLSELDVNDEMYIDLQDKNFECMLVDGPSSECYAFEYTNKTKFANEISHYITSFDIDSEVIEKTKHYYLLDNLMICETSIYFAGDLCRFKYFEIKY
jgi:hypothetical protein